MPPTRSVFWATLAAAAVNLGTAGFAAARTEAVEPEAESAILQRLNALEAEVQSLRAKPVVSEEVAPVEAPPAPKLKYPNVTINGVFQADAAVFNQDGGSKALTADPTVSDGPIQNGASFRRARLSARGSVAEKTNYFIQMDFAFFG
ncbi:MAG: hypothetical protein ACRC1K_24960, partial [Planctomycetia bacterium]